MDRLGRLCGMVKRGLFGLAADGVSGSAGAAYAWRCNSQSYFRFIRVWAVSHMDVSVLGEILFLGAKTDF
jgi:hypothetical protein